MGLNKGQNHWLRPLILFLYTLEIVLMYFVLPVPVPLRFWVFCAQLSE